MTPADRAAVMVPVAMALYHFQSFLTDVHCGGCAGCNSLTSAADEHGSMLNEIDRALIIAFGTEGARLLIAGPPTCEHCGAASDYRYVCDKCWEDGKL